MVAGYLLYMFMEPFQFPWGGLQHPFRQLSFPFRTEKKGNGLETHSPLCLENLETFSHIFPTFAVGVGTQF